jgi:hypothetical protein
MKIVDLLKRHVGSAGFVINVQPVPVGGARAGAGLRFVTRTVDKAEELAIELGRRAGVAAIENHLSQLWKPRFRLHLTTSSREQLAYCSFVSEIGGDKLGAKRGSTALAAGMSLPTVV